MRYGFEDLSSVSYRIRCRPVYLDQLLNDISGTILDSSKEIPCITQLQPLGFPSRVHIPTTPPGLAPSRHGETTSSCATPCGAPSSEIESPPARPVGDSGVGMCLRGGRRCIQRRCMRCTRPMQFRAAASASAAARDRRPGMGKLGIRARGFPASTFCSRDKFLRASIINFLLYGKGIQKSALLTK